MTITARLITGVGFTKATPDDERHGLIGFVTLVFAELLLLDGVTLRRTATGDYRLSFPARTDSRGCRHAYFRPQDDRARRLIERAVFAALGIDQQDER